MKARAERTTMVNGYISMDPWRDEQSRNRDLIVVDDPTLLYTEWAKFSAWRSHGRLGSLLTDLEFELDGEVVAGKLEAAIHDVQRAVAEMRAGANQTEHYGG